IDKKDIQSFECLLEKYSTKFHPTHYLLLLLKRHLITIWEEEDSSEESLQEKINLCEE
ncbi:Uncharacterized protein FKW44_009329, partial [Caligus rogercresseyi]